MSELIASARANLEAAQTSLTQAKAQHDSSKASYESAKKLHDAVVLAHSNALSSASIQNLCDSCQKIDFHTLFNHRGGRQKTGSTSRRGVGDLFNAIENQSTCPSCRFLLEACQLGRAPGEFLLHGASDARHSTIYLVQERLPWYNKAGIAAELPWCPYYWLQVGLPTDTGEPHICICLTSVNAPIDAENNINHSSSPRIRNPIEAFNGSINNELVRSWLDTCDRHHGKSCMEASPDMRVGMKYSLIDVATRYVVPALTSERYVALSYVWGKGAQGLYGCEQVEVEEAPLAGDGHVRTTRQQLRVPYPAPQTIEDAFIFVKRLGERYLWTDLYCIDQKDHNGKEEQIMQMDKIYTSAFVTIVALDGKDADWGLPGVSRPLEHTRQPALSLGIGKLTATYIYSIWDHAGTAIWDSRAWTLQERLLSRCCVVFAKSSISMRCKEEVFHDSMEEPLSQSISRHPTKLGDEYFWEDGSGIELSETEWDYKQYDAFVSAYTSRDITSQNDALNACRGILSMMTRNTGCRFVFGLPGDDLHRALLWKPHHNNTVLRRDGFPSWSWLGWIGRTEHAYWIGDMADYVDQDAHRPRKRLHGLEPFDPVQDVSADILSDFSQIEASNGLIRLSSETAKFNLCLQRKDGDEHNGLKPKSVQPSRAVGDHWTLLTGEAGTRKLRDTAGEYQVFETTDFFFRAHPDYRTTLEAFTVGRQKAEFLLVQRWPSIRDSKRSNKKRENLVSALLINKLENGKYERLASILLPWDEWQAAKPQKQVVELA
jgi:Heterokaryon incompatibility protein (HET)